MFIGTVIKQDYKRRLARSVRHPFRFGISNDEDPSDRLHSPCGHPCHGCPRRQAEDERGMFVCPCSIINRGHLESQTTIPVPYITSISC